jgi:hypothetical protein
MQSSDNGYVIEFYTTGATEPSVLEIQDKPGLNSFSKDKIISFVESKGYKLDKGKPIYIYDIVSANMEIDKSSDEYRLMGESAILNPFYGSTSIH